MADSLRDAAHGDPRAVQPPSEPGASGKPARAAWSRPLQTLLAVTTVALILVVSAALIALNYQRSHQESVEDAERSMRVFSERLVERFNALSDEATIAVGLVAAVPNALGAPPPRRADDKAKLMREVLRRTPHMDGIYAGYPDGSFFQVVNLRAAGWKEAFSAPDRAAFAVRMVTQQDGERVETLSFQSAAGTVLSEVGPRPTEYDPRLRPWYTAGLGTAVPVSIAPYRMATTGRIGMTVVQAHVADRHIVIGADIVLDTVTDYLAAEKITPGMVAFVVDTSGKTVIHSDRTFMSRLLTGEAPRKVGSTGDPIVDGIRADDRADGVPRFIEAAGEELLALVTPLRSSLLLARHRVVVAAPLDELTAEARRSLVHAMLISAMVVLAAVNLALLLSRQITKSLQRLTDSAARLQSLDFSTPVDVPSHVREIMSLSRAMNRARDAIFTFALYVPKEFVRKGIQGGYFTGRAASRQEITALFTDIYDFTTISEAYSPEQVVEMLSGYFDILEEVVTSHDGCIVQFLGDSVFAMWNAPAPDPKHAENACRAALDAEQRIAAFNEAQRANGLPAFRTRFGIHTGSAVVGSVGARDRLQYTAMGDSINVASRLEGMAKHLGAAIVASDAVRDRCSEAIEFRALGSERVKGRAATVGLYEVVSVKAADGTEHEAARDSVPRMPGSGM